MARSVPAERTRSNRRVQFLKALTGAWSWLFLLLVLIFFEVWARVSYGGTFLGRLYSVQSILLAATQILLIALGLTFVIISAGIDLSIAFTAGLAAVTMAVVIRALAAQPPLLGFLVGLVIALAVAALPGLVNGWMISRLGVPSFIGTLGMYGIARGMAYLVAGGGTVAISNPVATEFGNGTVFNVVPIPVLVAVVFTLLFQYLLSQTKFGLYTYAMGGNLNAAVRAGVATKRHTLILYVLSALTAGAAGIIYTSTVFSGRGRSGRTRPALRRGRRVYRRGEFDRWQRHHQRNGHRLADYRRDSVRFGLYQRAALLSVCGGRFGDYRRGFN